MRISSYFRNFFLIVITFIPISSSLMANHWPTKESKLGCEFQYDNYSKLPKYNKTDIFKVKKKLPFPQLDSNSTNKVIKTTPTHLFCNSICSLKNNQFAEEFRKIFPLEINKKVVIDVDKNSLFMHGVANITLKVIERRKSPYLIKSNEYLVETSIGRNSIIDDEPYYVTVRRLWWNTELGFFTEMITPIYTYRIKSASCLPENSLIQYDEKLDSVKN